MSETILSLQNIHKTFGTAEALSGVSLEVERGEFLTLLGPSGCGKTTTLRIIAGLEAPDSGQVLLQGQDVTGWEPNRRNVNTVFQSYALFPHMNVARNIGYGLRLKKTPKPEIARRVEEMLALVQLPGYGGRLPNQLSGGQRQRVAIARAIVNDPAVLLLDEPLGALDLQLRRQMQTELKALQKDLGITFIYITHDQEEALNMSDRIGIMNAGKILQLGTPDDVYERPQTRFAAEFIGQSNILHASVEQVCADGTMLLSFAGGTVKAAGTGRPGERLVLSVRTERVRFGAESQYGFALPGTVKAHSYTGGMLRTTLLLPDGQELTVNGMGGGHSRADVGEPVQVYWNPACAIVVEREGTP
ncbi:MAG: ABC transporter ATP-binding protein [Anaerotruncus sp.]|jgi:spermidine/putrescine transport system ATP-binding protein|uniref:ABC transporter ATP-binding protein n=1 Tax=Anaerotruncus sp. G3(2012) TaxID=1235835 RepID=UPI00033E3DD6|nr:ABC transporter ATP-binding protein [Anaerotruncus sp. G3(2012)]EOS56396.1 polyamine ABC transporter, ATP-binding protein [Anaerotruncus sp. G3(2012)]MCI9236716.1 ABC transporter ATP-binding protein [Anaerotruncus sp.]